MTIGISFTNGLEAIVITDTRAVGSGRQSDSVNKMGEFSNKNYHGVLFGAGPANDVERAIKEVREVHTENLDMLVANLQMVHQKNIEEYERALVASKRGEIERKCAFIPKDSERDEKIRQETTDEMERFEQYKHENRATLILVGFDKLKKRTRHFWVNDKAYLESHLEHIEIGSGSDGANMYFATKLQGAEPKKFDLGDLLFFVANGYSQATINAGVGGTPKIVTITSERNNVLPVKKSRVIANLSGAYLAEIPGLDRETVKSYLRDILNDLNREKEIARVLGINTNTLRTLLIPYSSWQERVNLK